MAAPEQGEALRRQRISRGLNRYHEVRRKQERVLPVHLEMIERGQAPPHLRALSREAARLNSELLEAMGGEDAVTPQQRLAVGIVSSLGFLAGAMMLRFQQTEDPDVATRAGSLLSTQIRALTTIGMERVAKDVDLRSYLATRAQSETAPQAAQHRAGEAIDAQTTNAPDPVDDRVQRADEGSE